MYRSKWECCANVGVAAPLPEGPSLFSHSLSQKKDKDKDKENLE